LKRFGISGRMFATVLAAVGAIAATPATAAPVRDDSGLQELWDRFPLAETQETSVPRARAAGVQPQSGTLEPTPPPQERNGPRVTLVGVGVALTAISLLLVGALLYATPRAPSGPRDSGRALLGRLGSSAGRLAATEALPLRRAADELRRILQASASNMGPDERIPVWGREARRVEAAPPPPQDDDFDDQVLRGKSAGGASPGSTKPLRRHDKERLASADAEALKLKDAAKREEMRIARREADALKAKAAARPQAPVLPLSEPAAVAEPSKVVRHPRHHAGRGRSTILPAQPERVAPPAPAATATEQRRTCEIRLWHGYVKSRFYAVAQRESGPETIAESSYFRRQKGKPPRSTAAASTLESFVASLERDGWTVENREEDPLAELSPQAGDETLLHDVRPQTGKEN
jgi:hypothetical protein